MSSTRPTATDPKVIGLCASLTLAGIKSEFGEQFDLPDDRALLDLECALASAEDGFQRVLYLKRAGWTVNERLVSLLSSKATGAARRALEQCEEAWVLDTGIRFPAKEGDTITFRPEHRAFAGKVVALFKRSARAKVSIQTYKDGKPVSVLMDVLAEQVTHRHDNNREVAVESIRPMVGFQVVESNGPALQVA